jgi:hypothetical protein
MQPFYLPESFGEHNARLSCAAFWGRQLEAAGRPAALWRRALGGVLVRAGNRLIAERCELGYAEREVRLS